MRPVEEVLQSGALQEGRRIRDRERRSRRAADGADIDRLGPSGECFAANQSHVTSAGLSGKTDEEAAPERRRPHVAEVWDRRGTVTTAGQEGGEDEQPGEAHSHDSRIR